MESSEKPRSTYMDPFDLGLSVTRSLFDPKQSTQDAQLIPRKSLSPRHSSHKTKLKADISTDLVSAAVSFSSPKVIMEPVKKAREKLPSTQTSVNNNSTSSSLLGLYKSTQQVPLISRDHFLDAWAFCATMPIAPWTESPRDLLTEVHAKQGGAGLFGENGISSPSSNNLDSNSQPSATTTNVTDRLPSIKQKSQVSEPRPPTRGVSFEDFDLLPPKPPPSSPKKKRRQSSKKTTTPKHDGETNEIVVCKYVHEGPYRPKTALARETYRAFLAERAAEGKYRPDAYLEPEHFREFLQSRGMDTDYRPVAAGRHLSDELDGENGIDFFDAPVATIEDFVMEHEHQQKQKQQQKSKGGGVGGGKRRPETAIAKDFFRAFLVARGEESEYRPDTAIAKKHYREFLSKKPDERILALQRKKKVDDSPKSASHGQRKVVSEGIPRIKTSPTDTNNGGLFDEENVKDANAKKQISIPLLPHPRPSTRPSSKANSSQLHTSTVTTIQNQTLLIPLHQNDNTLIRLSTPKPRSLAKQERDLYQPQTPKIRVFTPPSQPETKKPIKLLSHSKSLSQLTPPEQLPATTTELTRLPPRPHSTHLPPTMLTAPIEPTKPQQSEIITKYINRNRKAVKNRVTHGIPRKPPTPHPMQKAVTPTSKKPSSPHKTPVLPSVTKKPITSKPGTRPSTQQRVNFIVKGGGDALLGGKDSWTTFQNCLETAKAMGQDGGSGDPLSLLDTAELVTQLWNHYRMVKKQ